MFPMQAMLPNLQELRSAGAMPGQQGDSPAQGSVLSGDPRADFQATFRDVAMPGRPDAPAVEAGELEVKKGAPEREDPAPRPGDEGGVGPELSPLDRALDALSDADAVPGVVSVPVEKVEQVFDTAKPQEVRRVGIAPIRRTETAKEAAVPEGAPRTRERSAGSGQGVHLAAPRQEASDILLEARLCVARSPERHAVMTPRATPEVNRAKAGPWLGVAAGVAPATRDDVTSPEPRSAGVGAGHRLPLEGQASSGVSRSGVGPVMDGGEGASACQRSDEPAERPIGAQSGAEGRSKGPGDVVLAEGEGGAETGPMLAPRVRTRTPERAAVGTAGMVSGDRETGTLPDSRAPAGLSPHTGPATSDQSGRSSRQPRHRAGPVAHGHEPPRPPIDPRVIPTRSAGSKLEINAADAAPAPDGFQRKTFPHDGRPTSPHVAVLAGFPPRPDTGREVRSAISVEETVTRSQRPESTLGASGAPGQVSLDKAPVSGSRPVTAAAVSPTFTLASAGEIGVSDGKRTQLAWEGDPREPVVASHSGDSTQAVMAKDAISPREQLAAARGQPLPSPVRQLAEAIVTGSGGKLEVQLEPEELGRVRFHMQISEHGVALQVSADRPDTLDLLRRNADQLARLLTEAGYQGSTLSFSGQRRGGASQGRSGRPDHHVPDGAAAQGAPQAKAPARVAAAGLDLRL